MTINGEPKKVLPGETLALHPRDRVKIVEISTSVPLDYGVRLISTSIDVGGLRYEEIPLADLLPDENILHHYKFRVEVKYRVDVIGYMDWDIRPYMEDWLEKADRIIDDDRRIDLLKRAVSLMPGEFKIRRRLIDEYKSRGQWKEAAGLLEKIAGEKADSDILDELLYIYKKAGDVKGISSTLQRLVNENPKDIELRIELADYYEKQGNLRAAADQYESLQKIVSEDQAPAVYTRLGYLYSKMDRTEEAIAAYTKAIELEPQDADIYYSLSYLYEKTGDTKKAEENLSKALEINKNDMEGRLKLAQALLAQDELDKASDYAEQVLAKDPESMDALLLLAAIKEKSGEKDKLIEVYKKIHSLDPGNDTVLYNLAGLEYESGNTDESLIHFERYLTLHPEDREVHKILFNIYKTKNDGDSAYKHALALVDLNPGEMEPYRYIFEYLSSKSEYEEIIRIAKEGLKARPTETELMEYLVAAYLKTGKEELAENQMEELVKAHPEDIPLLLRLGKFKESRGELEDALQIYRKIIELSPGQKEAEEAYLRLRLKGIRHENEE